MGAGQFHHDEPHDDECRGEQAHRRNRFVHYEDSDWERTDGADEGEWHQFPDETYSDFLVTGFEMFDDHDRAKNTVDFGYWINGSGMAEVIAEQHHRRMSLRRWQREC